MLHGVPAGVPMHVRDIMTTDPVCANPDTPIVEVARLMAQHDCGEIPIIEHGKPTGVVTDRDITCRVVAKGRDLASVRAREVMSSPVVTVTADATVDDCCRAMEEHQVRRIPVVDPDGNCCGIVAQADIARTISERETGDVVKQVSRPTESASRVE
jgi:CBS domain-containing protein